MEVCELEPRCLAAALEATGVRELLEEGKSSGRGPPCKTSRGSGRRCSAGGVPPHTASPRKVREKVRHEACGLPGSRGRRGPTQMQEQAVIREESLHPTACHVKEAVRDRLFKIHKDSRNKRMHHLGRRKRRSRGVEGRRTEEWLG